MLTDLFAAVAGLLPEGVAAMIPPGCRRDIDTAVGLDQDGEDHVVTLPPWRPRRAARHLVPAFSALDGGACAFRFELSVADAESWSPWVGSATIGAAAFAPLPNHAPLTARIDEFVATTPVSRLRMRVRLRPGDVLRSPWLITLSATSASDAEPEGSFAEGQALDVPRVSQMEQSPALRDRVCAPASLAMVLAYWGRVEAVAALAAEVYHEALDIYGVWPAGIRAAARRGLAGYLLRFPDWEAAAWCLARGMPIIASIRYEAGELSGAAVARTSGHLVVLTALAGDDVLVNDPAAPSASAVARRYARREMTRVWLERTGVGYVLFRL